MVVRFLPADVEVLDVVGYRGSPVDSATVTHAAISRSAASLDLGDDCEVWHARPPVMEDKCQIHVAARLVSLTANEAADLQDDTADIVLDMPPPARRGLNHYQVKPAVSAPILDNKSRRQRHRKFSCAGFVIHVYRQIGIELIQHEDELPEIDLQTIEAHYPFIKGSGHIRRLCGIDGPGPWKVVLAGYVLRAFDRDDASIRDGHYFINSHFEGDFDTSRAAQSNLTRSKP